MIKIFALIGFFILVIACFNYINLITACAAWRTREIGIRKVIGASRKQLMVQFWSEAFLLSLLSTAMALLLARLCLPVFNSFAGTGLHLGLAQLGDILLWMIFLAVTVGFVAGGVPSLYLSSFRPLRVLRGNLISGSKRSPLRSILVVVQFTISITLITATLIVQQQLKYIRNLPLGFNRDNIVVVRLRDDKAIEQMAAIKQQLVTHPRISFVTSSQSLPNNIESATGAVWPGMPEDLKVAIYCSEVDYDLVKVFDLEISDGRNFSREHPADSRGAILINETAARALNWQQPVGRQLGHWGNRERLASIVGVIKDFHMLSVHETIQPLYFYLNPDAGDTISIKISGREIPETLTFIEETFKTFSPRYPFEYRFFDDIFNQAYRRETRLAQMFNAFAIIAVVIAALGLLGLANYVSERRTKEMGVRKVLGASSFNIICLFSREFNHWVLLANLLAWPITVVVMNNWLNGFAYHSSLHIGTFIKAALLALLAALFTVSTRSLKTARSNPTDSLRTE